MSCELNLTPTGFADAILTRANIYPVRTSLESAGSKK